MIHIIVQVELALDRRDAYLDLIQAYMTECRQEAGCLDFEATVLLHPPAVL